MATIETPWPFRLKDSGIEGRGLKKRKASGGKKGGKKKAKLSNSCGDSWDEDEQFAVEAIVGSKPLETRTKFLGVWYPAGTMVYRVVWDGYSADATTWEPAAHIEDSLLAEYEASLEAEAQLDAEEAAQLAAEEAAEAENMDTE